MPVTLQLRNTYVRKLADHPPGGHRQNPRGNVPPIGSTKRRPALLMRSTSPLPANQHKSGQVSAS
jgi:hypothetical protein